MKKSLREDKHRIVFVHDASGLFAGAPLNLPGKHYTTPKVVEEVKDKHSSLLLQFALNSSKLEIIEPQRKYLKEVEEEAKKIGEIIALSNTDISIIALALELKYKGYDVVVVTDDYAVQNTALHLGIEFLSMKTIGIKRTMRYKVYCPICGWEGVTSLKICPRCESALKRKPAKS